MTSLRKALTFWTKSGFIFSSHRIESYLFKKYLVLLIGVIRANIGFIIFSPFIRSIEENRHLLLDGKFRRFIVASVDVIIFTGSSLTSAFICAFNFY